MRGHDAFSAMKERKNPSAKDVTQPVTMRLDRDLIA